MKTHNRFVIALVCALVVCMAWSTAVLAEDPPALPTAAQMAADAVVSAAIDQAWTDSQAGDKDKRHEEGGWIIQDTQTGKLSVVRWPKGTGSSISPGAPPKIPCSRVVGHFHTHPNPPTDENGTKWEQGPSQSDKNFADHYGLPGIVKNAAGTESFGPATGGLPHTPVPKASIKVDATLDGSPWSGSVSYTLTGPGAASPIAGTSVAANFSVDVGSWTCAYVSGGPAGASLVSITPSPTQSVSAGDTITFTLNFVTPPPPLDASIEFDTWTINGQPVEPGTYQVPPDTIIDIRYKEHVDGEPGEVVTVDQTCWLLIHYEEGDQEVMWLHAVNADGAVSMDPPATKLYQVATVEGEPVPYCTEIPLYLCEPVALDVEVGWQLEVCTDYTKTINWLHFPEANGAPILFDILPMPMAVFTLSSYACIDLDGDVDPTNDCTDWCPPLTIAVALTP